MKKRIFSGIQPSGNIHIGNYLGAVKQWVELQEEGSELIFCVVDLHAITVPQDPKDLHEKILSIAAIYLAAGIDPNKSSIFVQSTVPAHSELAWLLNCGAKMGELSRMTQFKEKSVKGNAETAGVGLFDYPVLMAADILLYNTTHVPVGEDQLQHIELTRDLAQRFNSTYGSTFVIPEAIISKNTARIMGLDDPLKKMSKSSPAPGSYIALTDDPEEIRKKVRRAVTDSGSEIKAGPGKPAITNLLNIYSGVSGKSISLIEEEFVGKGYGAFKESLAEEIIKFLNPIHTRYNELMEDKDSLRSILLSGKEKVSLIAEDTLSDVKKKIGLGI